MAMDCHLTIGGLRYSSVAPRPCLGEGKAYFSFSQQTHHSAMNKLASCQLIDGSKIMFVLHFQNVIPERCPGPFSRGPCKCCRLSLIGVGEWGV